MATTKTLAVLDDSELKDGQMKEVDFENGKVLLSKLGEKIHATSAFCTHYGLPLSKGILLASGHVTCFAHGACFNVCTGDIEDAPAPGALHSFSASIHDGKIYVTADPTKVTREKKSRSPASFDLRPQLQSDSGVVIVGGGAGAIATIIGLRECGYDGPLTILSAEPHAPIDRTKLSKALVTDASTIELYNATVLKSLFGADLRTGVHVSSLDAKNKTVTLAEGGEKIKYGKLVLATGCNPRRLPIPGNDLPHVHVLRGVHDAQNINAALKEGKSLVVLGSSFIGMELLVAVAKRGLKEIHVVGLTKVPFEAVLGEEVGAGIRKYHESNGVKFHGEASAAEITETSVTVEYRSGERISIPADVVIMAVGVAPATEFLTGSGVEKRKDGGLFVDEFLRVRGVDDVYAIGDIAVFTEPVTGEQSRIEHWNVAQNHGRAAASAIVGNPVAFDKTPYFWSAQGQQLRYVGNGVGFDDVYIKGDPSVLKFEAYYSKKGKIIAVATMQADPLATKVSELLRMKIMPSLAEVKDGVSLLNIDVSSIAAHQVVRRQARHK